MAHVTDVLKKPVLTEKSLKLQQNFNKYTFDVETTATKTDVKKAVEAMFGVEVEKVNIMNIKPKTKSMVAVLNAFEADRKALFVIDGENTNVELSARNIPGVKVVDSKGINVYDILNSDKMFVTEAAVKAIEEVLG
jgi:large subunit ribosomal protein L23